MAAVFFSEFINFDNVEAELKMLKEGRKKREKRMLLKSFGRLKERI